MTLQLHMQKVSGQPERRDEVSLVRPSASSLFSNCEPLVFALQATPSKAVMQLFGAVAAAQLAISGISFPLHLHSLQPSSMSNAEGYQAASSPHVAASYMQFASAVGV